MSQEIPEPRPPESPVPLEYAPPVRPAGNVPYIGQMGIGCGASVLALVMLWGLLAVLSLVPLGAGGGGEKAVLVFGPLLMVAALLALAIIAWRRWRWRGFLLGVLISLGLILLAGGFCYALVSSIGR